MSETRLNTSFNVQNDWCTSISQLKSVVTIVKSGEQHSLGNISQITDMYGRITELAEKVHTSPSCSGILITVCANVIPFTIPEKVNLELAQDLVSCQWYLDGFRYQRRSTYVERFRTAIEKRTYTCLADEEGAIHGLRMNAVVTYMRSVQALEHRMKNGSGSIRGNVLILNRKAGWG